MNNENLKLLKALERMCKSCVLRTKEGNCVMQEKTCCDYELLKSFIKSYDKDNVK